MSWSFAVTERGLVVPGSMPGVTVLRDPAPKGLTGLPPLRTHDVERHVADGDAAGPDVFGPRLITLPVNVSGDGDTEDAQRASAMTYVRPLLVAWRPQRSGVVSLAATMPGLPEPTLTFYGRCRGIEESDWTWTFGMIRLGLNFTATDPFGYGALRTLTAATGSFVVAAGDPDAMSERLTLTIHGNGGTPLLVNSAAPSNPIGFSTTVAGGTSVVLDVEARTATSGGVDVASWLDGSNRWFPIVGGATNTLTLTGAASVDVAWRPAYL